MTMPIWMKVGIGWSIATATGVYGFILSKRSINAKRYENMKVRQRMRESNLVD